MLNGTNRGLEAIALAVCVFGMVGEAGATLDKCKAKINGGDGTVLVSAVGVTGNLLWGDAAGSEDDTFFEPCVSAGVAKNCKFGAAATLAGITPPPGCTVYLADDTSSCSAYIKKCTPGVRDQGALEADVAALDARVDLLEAPLPPAAVNRIFVTSTGTDGAFGGLAGADAICAQAATNAQLHGTWIAWLSDSVTDAVDRLAVGSGPFLTMDGETIATSIADLTDGALLNAIEQNEFTGAEADVVWTGTLADGTGSVATCSDWTSTAGIGMAGVTGSTGGSWTNNGGASCTNSIALFCIEQ